MAKLIYGMITSLDGYAAATEGDLGAGAEDPEVHTYIGDLWLERDFDPDAVRRLKQQSDGDLTIDGPTLATQAIRAGLVDEYHLFMTTSVVGGGTRFFPDGVRLDLELVDQRAFASGLIHACYRTR